MDKSQLMHIARIRYYQEKNSGKSREQALNEMYKIIESLKLVAINVDTNEVVKELEKETIPLPGPQIIKEENIEPWLLKHRKNIDWEHYNRFREFMENKDFPINVIDSTDGITNEILDMIGYPKIRKKFDVRGMVVGYVQSGKTNNYITLINKAIDCGYKFIIILAGMHNDLRSQTQYRVDEQILGVETSIKRDKNSGLGVGLDISGKKREINIQYLTSRENNGDFKKARADAQGKYNSNTPHVLVVKKNKSILENLVKYIEELKLPDLPMLLIDDEADQASVNTKKQDEDSIDYDRTTINSYINDILGQFTRKTYIGYTATPYANVFITKEGEEDNYKDIFPKDFIISMPKPENYQGAEEIFGDKYKKYFREITDLFELIAQDDMKDKDADVSDFKDLDNSHSLKKAIYTFLCAIAIKKIRGIKGHNSMLIHLVLYKNVQSNLKREVKNFIEVVRSSLRQSKNSEISKAIKKVLETEYSEYGNRFEEILDLIIENLDPLKLKIEEFNGNSKSSLDYTRKDDLNVIAIGGNKLSRGLTLEGLTVSYYMRKSPAYDTLTQMGRWFGYRDNYEDICRIYTSLDIVKSFKNISEAEQELREMIEEMKSEGMTPKEFQLRVRHFPGLMVTANNKKRNAIKKSIGYASSLIQTKTFDIKNQINNYNTTLNFVNEIKSKEVVTDDEKFKVFKGVKLREVIKFLSEYKTSENSRRVDNDSIISFLRATAEKGEFKEWDIYIRNLNSGKEDKNLNVLYGERGVQSVSNKGRTFNTGVLLEGDVRNKIGVEGYFNGIDSIEAKKRRKKGKGHLIIYPFVIGKKVDGIKEYCEKTPHIGLGYIFGGSNLKIGSDYFVNKTHKYEGE